VVAVRPYSYLRPVRGIYHTTIQDRHIDGLGHVNNAAYLTLFEEARWHVIAERGYTRAVVEETGLAPVVLEILVKFKRELRQGQSVRIETYGLSYDHRIGKMMQELYDDQDKLSSTAEIKFALFDLRTRKIVSATPAWLAALGLDPSRA
jgi:thioesterase III